MNAERLPAAAPGMALPALAVALALFALLTVRPSLLVDPAGRADHLGAVLACWAMCAGFVRGVGFVPRHRLPRLIFSGSACALALALVLLRLLPPASIPFLLS